MGIGVGCVIRTEDQKVPITATGSRCKCHVETEAVELTLALAEGCSPDNSAFETSGCACVEDSECTCQVFTGAEFVEAAEASSCVDGACVECFYE